MKISEIAGEVEKIAPLKLAQDWDNVGLLVGSAAKNVKNILITIDITADVVAEARRLKADMILSYHPVIWDGLKQVTADGASAVVYELIKAGICVYSIHTAFDAAMGGVNDALADIVGIIDPEPIGDFVGGPGGEQYKLVTFVPVNDVNTVAEAIYAAGAGRIGNYSHCGFQTEGVGTFLPLEGAKPTIGERGRFEKVDEIKLEAVVPGDKVGAVVSAMRKAHPYETPAFDVFRHYDVESKFGLGRMGTLAVGEALSIVGAGTVKDIRKCIENLNEKYEAGNFAFRIEQIAGGYQMMTLGRYNHWLKKLLRARTDTKLSQAALETLAIIAYKQPVMRADIEAIRGVAAGEVIRGLMYKGLVKIVGRAEVLGRPMLYGTTKRFLEVFGLNTIKDLPKVEELKKPE